MDESERVYGESILSNRDELIRNRKSINKLYDSRKDFYEIHNVQLNLINKLVDLLGKQSDIIAKIVERLEILENERHPTMWEKIKQIWRR